MSQIHQTVTTGGPGVPAPTASASVTNAAPPSQAILAQTRAELTMTLRRGEGVLVTIIMPVLFLVFFAALIPIPNIAGRPIDFLLPGIIAVAVMSSGMVSLGIATAYERYYGVLKRLGASPLPRWGLLAAKLLAVLVLEVAQIAVLVCIGAVFFGWRPAASAWLAAPIVLLGTITFAGLGLLMAGALRAEATLAGANGLYVIFLAIGGIFLPVDHFPPFLQVPAQILPPAALADALRGALTGHGVAGADVLLLALWGGIFLVAASLTFRWE